MFFVLAAVALVHAAARGQNLGTLGADILPVRFGIAQTAMIMYNIVRHDNFRCSKDP